MRYRVRHLTGYRYSDPVQLCRNEACLLPRNTPHQRCLDSRLEVVPLVTEIEERRDFFDNRLHFFAIQTPHNSLSITAVSTIDVEVDQTGYALGAQLPWEQARMGLTQTGELLNSAPYMYNSPHVTASAALADYAIPSFGAGRSITDAVDELMQRIYHDFTYDPEVTNVSTPLTEVLANRHGVCQDFSHVAIGCLRSIGLAARYVSGYIETLPPVKNGWWGPMHPMPGFRCMFRRLAGLILIRPTTSAPISNISPWPGVGIFPMCPRSKGSHWEEVITRFWSRLTSPAYRTTASAPTFNRFFRLETDRRELSWKGARHEI